MCLPQGHRWKMWAIYFRSGMFGVPIKNHVLFISLVWLNCLIFMAVLNRVICSKGNRLISTQTHSLCLIQQRRIFLRRERFFHAVCAVHYVYLCCDENVQSEAIYSLHTLERVNVPQRPRVPPFLAINELQLACDANEISFCHEFVLQGDLIKLL